MLKWADAEGFSWTLDGGRGLCNLFLESSAAAATNPSRQLVVVVFEVASVGSPSVLSAMVFRDPERREVRLMASRVGICPTTNNVFFGPSPEPPGIPVAGPPTSGTAQNTVRFFPGHQRHCGPCSREDCSPRACASHPAPPLWPATRTSKGTISVDITQDAKIKEQLKEASVLASVALSARTNRQDRLGANYSRGHQDSGWGKARQ